MRIMRVKVLNNSRSILECCVIIFVVRPARKRSIGILDPAARHKIEDMSTGRILATRIEVADVISTVISEL